MPIKTTVHVIGDRNLNDTNSIKFEKLNLQHRPQTASYVAFIVSPITNKTSLRDIKYTLQNIIKVNPKRVLLVLPSRLNTTPKKLEVIKDKLSALTHNFLQTKNIDTRVILIKDDGVHLLNDGHIFSTRGKKLEIHTKTDTLLYPIGTSGVEKCIEVGLFKPACKNTFTIIESDKSLHISDLAKQILTANPGITPKYSSRAADYKMSSWHARGLTTIRVPSGQLHVEKVVTQKKKVKKIVRKNKKIKKKFKWNKKSLKIVSALLVMSAVLTTLLYNTLPTYLKNTIESSTIECVEMNNCQRSDAVKSLRYYLATSLDAFDQLAKRFNISRDYSSRSWAKAVEKNHLDIEILNDISSLMASMFTKNLPSPSLYELSENIEEVLKSDIEDKHTYRLAATLLKEVDTMVKMDNLGVAIVLQDSDELRPTGGFISSIAWLNISKGKLIDYKVFDSYELDDRLNGSVEPPDSLETQLNEDSWFLRDANWSPSVRTSVSDINWFLEKEIGQMPAYTILLNSLTIKNILDTSAFDEFMLQDETDMDAGESDIFEKVGTQEILHQLATNPNARLSIGLELLEGIKEGQLIILNNQSSLLIPESASIPPTTDLCEQLYEYCKDIFIYLNEANSGINKTNKVVSRAATIDVAVKNNAIMTTYDLMLQNSATTNNWPLGSYRTFIRLVTNPETQLYSIAIDGNNIDASKINITPSIDFVEIGFPVLVPIESTTNINVVTKTSLMLLENPSMVRIHIPKQPGVTAFPLRIKQNQFVVNTRQSDNVAQKIHLDITLQ